LLHFQIITHYFTFTLSFLVVVHNAIGGTSTILKPVQRYNILLQVKNIFAEGYNIFGLYIFLETVFTRRRSRDWRTTE